MFPLGGVLLPHQVLPLHVFEPRYRDMVRDVLEGDREFGVCLIAKGHEVGGEDVRTDWGAVARVLQAEELEDGRWLVVTVGTRRFDVEEWLDDDPYPRARIVELDEPVPMPIATEQRSVIQRQLRRVLAMMAEMGLEAAPATTDLADDPLAASFQASVLAPVGPMDKLRLLRAEDAETRFDVLAELLSAVEEQQALELAMLGQQDGPIDASSLDDDPGSGDDDPSGDDG